MRITVTNMTELPGAGKGPMKYSEFYATLRAQAQQAAGDSTKVVQAEFDSDQEARNVIASTRTWVRTNLPAWRLKIVHRGPKVLAQLQRKVESPEALEAADAAEVSGTDGE